MGDVVSSITDGLGLTSHEIGAAGSKGDTAQFDKDAAAAKDAQAASYKTMLDGIDTSDKFSADAAAAKDAQAAGYKSTLGNIDSASKANTQAFDQSYAQSSAGRQVSADQSTLAANTAANVASTLGVGQIQAAQSTFDNATAFNKPALDAQSSAAQAEFAQGNKNLAAYDSQGRPLQQTIRDDAMGIVTPEKQQLMDQAAGTAIADARNGTTQQQNMMMREGARYGFSADKLSEMGGAAAASGASAQVAAANAGRVQAGDKFTANINNAYKTYADLQTSGANLINSGVNATSAAATTNNQTAAQYINGLTAGAGTIQAGQGQRITGLGGVLNSNTAAYSTDASAKAGNTNAILAAQTSAFGTNTGANTSISNAAMAAKSSDANAILNAKASAFGTNTNANTAISTAAMAAKSGVTNANTSANASMYNTQANNNSDVMGTIIGAGVKLAPLLL